MSGVRGASFPQFPRAFRRRLHRSFEQRSQARFAEQRVQRTVELWVQLKDLPCSDTRPLKQILIFGQACEIELAARASAAIRSVSILCCCIASNCPRICAKELLSSTSSLLPRGVIEYVKSPAASAFTPATRLSSGRVMVLAINTKSRAPKRIANPPTRKIVLFSRFTKAFTGTSGIIT